MPFKGELHNQNEVYAPSDEEKAWQDINMSTEEFKAKHDFEEKYGDHIVWESLDENDPETQKMFEEYPWTKERWEESKKAAEKQKDDDGEQSPFGDAPNQPPYDFI